MYKVTAYLLSERKYWPMFCLLTALRNMESIKAVLIEIKGRCSHDLCEMDRWVFKIKVQIILIADPCVF